MKKCHIASQINAIMVCKNSNLLVGLLSFDFAAPPLCGWFNPKRNHNASLKPRKQKRAY